MRGVPFICIIAILKSAVKLDGAFFASPVYENTVLLGRVFRMPETSASSPPLGACPPGPCPGPFGCPSARRGYRRCFPPRPLRPCSRCFPRRESRQRARGPSPGPRRIPPGGSRGRPRRLRRCPAARGWGR